MPARHRRASLALNLTPLIDIVFLLLVFFMLTAHFVEEESLSVDLPDAASADSLEAQESLEIVIAADGAIHIAGRVVAADKLEAAIRAALGAASTVQLRGDAGTPLQQVVEVMDAARRAGAEALDIVTEQP